MRAQENAELRVVIIGMEHGHVEAWLRQDYEAELNLVGICESNVAVVGKYTDRFQLDKRLFYSDLPKMLDALEPDVAWVFTSTFGHESAVIECAKRGIHSVVEKPLATTVLSARRIIDAAKNNDVQVVTNYETSFHPSILHALELARSSGSLGDLKRFVGSFGHGGPIELGCPSEFTDWLTDPVLNGGGASADFGCYGYNLVSYLRRGERPKTVTARINTLKPEVYREVDDDATIVLEYADGFRAVIQPSWNWSYNRKDIEIHGDKGVVRTIDRRRYDYRNADSDRSAETRIDDGSNVWTDSIRHFAAVFRGEQDAIAGLESMELNLRVVEIVEAAAESAKTGKTVILADYFDAQQ